MSRSTVPTSPKSQLIQKKPLMAAVSNNQKAGPAQKPGKPFGAADPTKGAGPSSKKVHGRPSDLSGKHLHPDMRGKRSSEV